MICWMPLGAERCLVVPVAERDRAGADYQAVPPVFAIAQIDHWLHPANEALRERRPSPELLFEGDVVAIPEKQPRKEDAVTARTHRYVLNRAPRFLRLRLRDVLGEPVANARYTLIIDGATVAEGALSTSEGLVEQEIHVSARRGRLITDDYAWDLDLAYLNPVEHAPDQGISGAQGRLLNLGYDVGPVDGVLGARTRAAVRRFQGDQALPATGELDPATLAKLVESHGC